MRKKAILIIGALLACCICGVIIFYQVQPQLVTGEKDELLQVVVTEYARSEEIVSTTTFSDQQTMFEIFDECRKARPIAGNHQETEFTMISPHYQVVFSYPENSDTVEVYSTSVGRYLGKPDMFTVSETAKIDNFITSILDRKNK